MPKFIVLPDFVLKAHELGLIEEDPTTVRRIVIDLEVGRPAKIYLEKYVDDEKLAEVLDAGLVELPAIQVRPHNPDEPHPFIGMENRCEVCGKDGDDPIHGDRV